MDHYDFNPTLKHLALAKMTTGFWRESKIMYDAGRLYASLRENRSGSPIQDGRKEGPILKEWGKIEKKVLENAKTFADYYGDKSEPISKFIKPIGKEIFRWMTFICMYCKEAKFKEYLGKLQWTAVGFVDGEGMAKMMVWDAAIYIGIRFDLACRFCLSDDIRRLWAETDIRNTAWENEDRGFVRYWRRIMVGENAYDEYLFDQPHDFVSTYRYIFRYLEETTESEPMALRMAVHDLYDDYLKLSSDDFMGAYGNYPIFLEYNAECFLFLLSKARKYGVDLFNRETSLPLLVLFLEWPLQSEFERVMLRDGFLDTQSEPYVISYLLSIIFQKILYKIYDYDYSGLFNEFWKKCPLKKRREFMEKMADFDFRPRVFTTVPDSKAPILTDDAVYFTKKL